VHVDIVSHLSLGTPCMKPEGIETSSPYLSLEIGDNIWLLLGDISLILYFVYPPPLEMNH
jgi:hypothetical protein